MARLADRVALGLALFGVCVLGLATLALMADISMRRTVNVSITGIVDLTQLAQVYCVALAMPMAFLRESHVGVEFITDRLPGAALRGVKGFAHLMAAAFMAAIAWYSVQQAGIQINQGDKSQTLGLPIALYWGPLIAGATLSAAASLLLSVRDFAGRETT